MNAAKRKSRSRKPQPAAHGAAKAGNDVWDRSPSGLLAGLAVAFFIARLLIPTEAAALGESLWLTQCWLMLAVAWVIDAYRRGQLRWNVDRLDVAVGAMVAGHVLSAGAVLLDGGDKRSALNMLWEWVGLGVSFVLLRQVLQTRLDVRRFLWAFTSVVVVLAGLGFYQHYVEFPANAAEFAQMRDRLQTLKAPPARPLSFSEVQQRQKEIKELTRRLPPESLNEDGTIRKSFENRLLSSTEPFGTFALANTFAGLLGVGLIPLLAMLAGAIRQRRWAAVVACAAAALAVAYCLLLTKSRTAWVGVAAGIAVWLWLSRQNAQAKHARIVWWGTGAAAGVLLIAVVAAVTGGVDRKTISESPKSLRYRLQYWTGTAQVLRDRPIFGTGPANFRQQYVKYKVPEASEEIRDPHNLFLDVWVSGGLLALAGLVGVGLLSAAPLRYQRHPPTKSGLSAERDREEAETAGSAYTGMMWVAGTAGGFLLVLGAGELINQSWDSRLLPLAGAVLGMMALLSRAFANSTVSAACIAGCAAVLWVHLLGAGGVEYPAIAQLLILAPVLLRRQVPLPQTADSLEHKRAPGHAPLVMVWLALTGTLCGLCWLSASWPVQKRQWLMSAGEYEWRDRGRLGPAEAYLQQAAEADPLSPDPTARLAQLAFFKWSSGEHTDKLFTEAVNRQIIVIQQDPNSSARYRVLGKWYAERYAVTENARDAHKAVDWFRESLQRYPHHSATVAELAVLQSRAGLARDAAASARRAIELDDINHEANHTDRVLPRELRKRLERIRAASPTAEPE